jgi:hypothetical protein
VGVVHLALHATDAGLVAGWQQQLAAVVEPGEHSGEGSRSSTKVAIGLGRVVLSLELLHIESTLLSCTPDACGGAGRHAIANAIPHSIISLLHLSDVIALSCMWLCLSWSACHVCCLPLTEHLNVWLPSTLLKMRRDRGFTYCCHQVLRYSSWWSFFRPPVLQTAIAAAPEVSSASWLLHMALCCQDLRGH